MVWNIKCQQQRLVELIPNDDWGGAGLLGVTIRLDNYGGADERLIRVLNVEHNSPASIAGLVPLQDYLLGTTVTAFGSSHALATVLQYHVDRVVEIYVYNSDSDVVRVVALMPTYNWGGKGLLGAEVGTGYLHRLPANSRTTIGQSVERKVRWMGSGIVAPDDANNNSSSSSSNSNYNTIPLNNGEEHDQTSSANARIPQLTHPSETLLEMEPHLEMEVEHDEEGRKPPEEATKQPHELGTVENNMPKPLKIIPIPFLSEPSNQDDTNELKEQITIGDTTKESAATLEPHNKLFVDTTTTSNNEVDEKSNVDQNNVNNNNQNTVDINSDKVGDQEEPYVPKPLTPLNLSSFVSSPTQPRQHQQPQPYPTTPSEDAEALFAGPPPGTKTVFVPSLPPPPKMTH